MLAHVLALHLALLGPATAPEVHVLPPLELAAPRPALADAAALDQVSASPVDAATEDAPGSAAGASGPATEGRSDAAPLVVRAESQRGSVAAGYGGALAGTLAADVVFGGLVVAGVEGWADHGGFFSRDSGGSGWAFLALGGMTGLIFATPAIAVWGAQKATARRGLGAAAYAAAFAIRLVGVLLAPRAPALLIATEFVAAPLAVGAIVASGSPFELRITPPPDFPDEPVPLPGPAGPRISRPLCPDAALALR